MAATGDVVVREHAALPESANKVVARVSTLVFNGYRDHVAVVGRDLRKLAGCILFVTRCIVNSKFVPAAFEVDTARRVLLDFLRACNAALEPEEERHLVAMIDEFRDLIRYGSQQWKPRGAQ